MEILKRVFDSEIKGIDEKERTLTAYVSTSARDRMDEVLIPEGVDLTKYKKNPIVLWAHDYSMPPIGKALWIKKDGQGVISKMQFANTEFAQEIFNLYKDGFMKAFSVGFIPKEHEDGDGQKSPRRTYKKWEMLEYSAVPVPANPEALTLAISKGVLRNEQLKTALSFKSESMEEKEGCEGIGESEPVIEKEPVKAEQPPAEKKDAINGELMAEIDLLKKETEKLKKTILDLRYELAQKSVSKDKTLSEMTDSEILSKIEEVTVGVIRKFTGRIN